MENVSEKIQALQSQVTEHQEAITALQGDLSKTDQYVAAYFDYRHNNYVLDSLLGDPVPSDYKDIILVKEQRAEIYKKMYPHRTAIKSLQAQIKQLQGLQIAEG